MDNTFKDAAETHQELSAPKSLTDHRSAGEVCERIKEMIADFEKRIDQDHEVGIRLVNFGKEMTFHFENIAYHEPNLVRFSGFLDDKSPVELIQHVSHINFLLMAIKRLNAKRPKIGFSTREE
ncbi:MAG: DUF6173 family protein [Nitrospirota bacterium]